MLSVSHENETQCQHLEEREEKMYGQYFMFNVKENKTLCKPCGVTLIGRNAEKNVHVIFYSTESLVCYNLMIFSQLKLKA